MTLSDLSIRKPVFAWMLMSALLIFGWISFERMGVSLLPDTDNPVVEVSVTYEGAAPEVMESDVIDPIEEAILSIPGIQNISSSARAGSASVTVEFDLDRNIDLAAQEVQTKVAQAQRRLPDEIDPPVVSKSSSEDRPLLWFVVTSDKMSRSELMTFVRDRVKDQFATIPGVSDIFLGGYVDPNLRVWVSSWKLSQYALTVDDIINTIQAEHVELPSGRIETADQEMNIRMLGEARSVKEFGDLQIKSRGGAPNFNPVSLSQVTRIEEGLADIRRISRFNGVPTVGVGIRKQRGANSVAVAQAAKLRAQELAGALPQGVKLQLSFDSTQFIEEAVHELNFTLILSAVLTALVCWLFLGSWQGTLNVILAIPTSVLGSFIALYFLGFTLNTFTLLGLSLGIGIIVDDAIMVLENIVRHFEENAKAGKYAGDSRRQRVFASLHGARQITFSAMAATAAIIAIFLPVAFMKGVIGKFFFQFGVTISVAVALSLLEALTLTPMRCAQFMEVTPRLTRIGRAVEALMAAVARAYERILPVLLEHRWKTIGASLVVFAASLSLFGVLKKEFVPSQDIGRLFVRVQTPLGSSLAFTDEKVKQVEALLKNNPNVERFFTAVGGFGGGDVNTAILMVTLKAKKERVFDPKLKRKPTQQDMASALRAAAKDLPKLKLFVQDLSMTGFGGGRNFPVEFSLRGPDWERLIGLSETMKKEMEASGKMTDIDSDFRGFVSEVRVIPDRERAKLRGVSTDDIGRVINALLGGVVVGRYFKDGHRYDIRVKLEEPERESSEIIKTLYVRNNRGELIRLSDVVRVESGPGPQVITRENRERAVALFANVSPASSQQEALRVTQEIAKKVLPEGYHLATTGSARTFRESMSGLWLAFILGLVVSYMILASQFNSFAHPLTVLVALPFSLSGALVALWGGGQSVNVYSVIGMLLLMGIVKKNSILLVDFTNQLRAAGKDTKTSLLEACPMRLRAILMTSFSTVAGAIPPALAIGPGAETRIPMALTLIGGVAFSTLLTLFVVPCVYSLMPGRVSENADWIDVEQPGQRPAQV